MGKIHKLSPALADMIAAGEVVERPASVIKELVENAIDAEATQITVEIQNGGVTFMRVTDNGSGISAEDAPTAFLRHATSKISRAEDLNGIVTMGFRGEALAAISAVSKIELLTRTADEPVGTSLRVAAGNVLETGPAGCPQGTTIIVRELFYNTPARMKFLKRDSVEGSYIAGAVQRQALAHPEIAFRFIRDGKPELSTPGDGKLMSAIYAAMGRQVARDMVEVRGSSDGVTVQGYVGRPTASRGSRSYQHFFVNGRYVKSKMMSAALEEAYKNQLMVGRFPVCVLHVSLAPTAVDVNVHPAKTEVKFLREGDVFDAIHYIVLGTLNRTQDRPELTLSQPRTPTQPQSQPQPQTKPRSGFYQTMTAQQYREKAGLTAGEQTQAREFLGTLHAGEGRLEVRDSMRRAPVPQRKLMEQTPPPMEAPTPPAAPVPDLTGIPRAPAPMAPARAPALEPQMEQTAMDLPPAPEPKAPAPAPETKAPEKPQAQPYRIIGQTMDTYIMVEQGDRLLIFDKHAAHERILFERLRAREHPVMSQVLLSPMQVELDRAESALLLEREDLLGRLGFELEDYGGGTLLVRAIPGDIGEDQVPEVLSELAGDLLTGKRLDPAAVYDELLHTVACKAAIKGGRYTAPEELSALVAELMSRDDIQHCPHGRPVCVVLTKNQLERQFGRSG